MTESYPRLAARTLRFTLGVPRNLTVSPDGGTVRFIRTPDGVSRSGGLWEYDVATGEESLLVDPVAVLGGADEDLSPEERARRERSREGAGGLVSYDVDETGRWACFALSGRLFAVHLGADAVRELPAEGAVIDPRLDPTGRHVAYANSAGELRVVDVAGREDRALVTPATPTEVWGRAEFTAAEEMDRHRGFWWAPDGRSLLVERYDDADVEVWHVADPAHPDRPAVEQRYPAAGTANSVVTLWHVPLEGGEPVEIAWDHDTFEYLARVDWSQGSDPLLQVLSRDQQRSLVLEADPATGATRTLRELADDAWVELSAGPRRDPQGRLVTVEDVDGRRCVCVDGAPVSGDAWQVRSIVAVDEDGVLATASDEPTEVHLVRFAAGRDAEVLTEGTAVHGAVVGGGTTVVVRTDLDSTASTFTVRRGDATGSIRVLSEPAPLSPSVELVRLGERELRAAVLFPRDHVPGSQRLPLLLDPYGGPGAQRVLASGRMFLKSQWMADQGFCVVVSDGRGTPGRGSEWDRAIHHRFAEVTLQDQVDTVAAIAERYPDDVDTGRVGITGWSYGGYLAALAVLQRPDVFHAAVAGAPVTEWRLYDTCYTERYLGHPAEVPEVYDANSLLPLAPRLERPLMLIHGLADDNVVAAHTLRLSSALLAAGRPHTVLPLSGVTHMTPQEEVAENLELIQMEFLRQQLA
ncbi:MULTISPECIES: prolyl oligopeptidase family serine peptidase [unclassified Aeromicrobium]|uniref:S9 family peptidase n=1 Tax=unclassified Aeromicrobium TaxID=2633570 RepID=UPI00396B4059